MRKRMMKNRKIERSGFLCMLQSRSKISLKVGARTHRKREYGVIG